ncbi:MAG: Holliday junction resolvase RuvX, partial [Candidatus Komeilibacteria bacterium]|nr:Holliday junction resolvase RuvX [Candidatus Komeilibacteria bacterium]
YPLSLSGEAGEQAKEVDDFIEKLRSLSIPIAKQDERFSTKSAVAAGDDDASAAALILQTYLDSHKP